MISAAFSRNWDVGRSQVALQPMSLRPGALPGTGHDGVRHAELLAEATRRPCVVPSVGGLRVQLKMRPQYTTSARVASSRDAGRANREAVRLISRLPSRDRLRRAIHTLTDGRAGVDRRPATR